MLESFAKLRELSSLTFLVLHLKTHKKETPSKKIKIYTKSMNTEVFKVYIQKPVFVGGGTNEVDWFIRNFPGFFEKHRCL